MVKATRKKAVFLFFCTITPIIHPAGRYFNGQEERIIQHLGTLVLRDDQAAKSEREALLQQISTFNETFQSSQQAILMGLESREETKKILHVLFANLLNRLLTYANKYMKQGADYDHIETTWRKARTNPEKCTRTFMITVIYEIEDILDAQGSESEQPKEHVVANPGPLKRSPPLKADFDVSQKMLATLTNLKSLGIMPPRCRNFLSTMQASLKTSLENNKPSMYWAVWLAITLYETIQIDEHDTALLDLLAQYRGNLLNTNIASRIHNEVALLPDIAHAIFAKFETLTLPPETTHRLHETKQETIACIDQLTGFFQVKTAQIILKHLLMLGRELELHCHTNSLDYTNPIAQATIAIIVTATCLQSNIALYQNF